MAKTVEGLYYSESHEWVKVEGDVAVIGITDYAQHSMGDLSYVDMPEVDDELEAGDVSARRPWRLPAHGQPERLKIPAIH